MISVSTMIPKAILAGAEQRLPSTIREELALENPSLEEDVGMLMKGSFCRNPTYFAASMTLPPPIPITACVLLGRWKASSVMSSNLTESISWYSNT